MQDSDDSPWRPKGSFPELGAGEVHAPQRFLVVWCMVIAVDTGSDGKERREGKREDNTLLKCTVYSSLHCIVVYYTVPCSAFYIISVYKRRQSESSMAHWHMFDLKDECTTQMSPRKRLTGSTFSNGFVQSDCWCRWKKGRKAAAER